MTPVRPVLDTNVLASSLLFPSGAVSWMRGAWRQGSIRPLVSRETTAELIRVLAYPTFALNSDDQRDLPDDYLPYCESVKVPVAPPAIPDCRDPFGRPFLHVALGGRADALASGDADILALADAFAVPIRSPTAFRRRLSGGEGADE